MEPANLSRLESGKHFPKEETLEKLATILNVEMQELFTFEHYKSSGRALLADIAKLLETAEESEIKLIYRLILAVLR
jgi:transcriptional regulator with XRE-family HTH domain